MFRCHAGKNHLFLHDAQQIIIGHLLQFHAGYHADIVTFDNSDVAGDAFSRQAVIAGDHDNADAGIATLLNCSFDVGAGRVHHRDHTQKGLLGFYRFH